MDRLPVRAAVLATVALLVAGCSTNPLDVFSLTGPAAEQSAKDSDAVSPTKDVAQNLDDEIRQAQLLRTKGDFEGASRILAQLMLVAPDDPRVIGEYGKVLAERGRSSDAAAFLERAIQLQPNDWSLYSALGVAYDQLGERDKARTAYGNALRLDPGEATVLNNFALSRMLAGDLPMAASLSAEAAAKDPGNAKIVANRDMIAGMLKARGEAAPDAGAQAANTAPAKAVAIKSLSAPAVTRILPPPAGDSTASAAPKPLAPVADVIKLDGKRVIMEKVPFDPYAGPVKEARRDPTRPPHKLAGREAPKLKKQVAETPKNAIPALRTAAD